jgi:hypothetical protein
VTLDEDKLRQELLAMAEKVEYMTASLNTTAQLPGIAHFWFFRLIEAAQKGTDFAIALRQAAR